MFKKFAWTLTSLLGVCFLFLIVYLIHPDLMLKQRDPSLFLIPQGFEGVVTINYGQPGSEPLPSDGTHIVYNIPPDGVLNTSTPEPSYTSTADNLYVEVDEAGNRQELPLEWIQGEAIVNKQQMLDGHLVKLAPVQYFHVVRPAVQRTLAKTVYPEAVVWEDSLYLMSVDQVSEEQLGQKLGEVKRIVHPMPFADGDANSLQVGDRYFAIKGHNQYEAIAVEKDGVFTKAIRQETYR